MLALAPALLASNAAIGRVPKVVKKATVDGQRFKVVWQGHMAMVERKGMFFKADADMYTAAIKTAEQVSGCRATSNFTPEIGVVAVVLDCSKASAIR